MTPLRRWKKRFFKHLRLMESWVLFFLLGILMMNYPFIHIFNKNIQLFGVPLLFLYLMGGWAVSIFVIFLFSKAMGESNSHKEERR